MQVYGLVGQTEEGIWPEARAGTTYTHGKCASINTMLINKLEHLCKMI